MDHLVTSLNHNTVGSISNSAISNPCLSRTILLVPTILTYISLISLTYRELFLSRTHLDPNIFHVLSFLPGFVRWIII